MHKSDLADVLKKNPFTPALLKRWGKSLRQYKNGDKKVCKLRFSLPGDSEEIIEKSNSNYGLHLELLPQPFLGDPSAPIWLMLLNPGYHIIDTYDHLGYCPLCKRICSRKDKLLLRQKFLLDQLRFKRKGFFFAFDEAFKDSYDLIEGRGIYGWWEKALLGFGKSSYFLMDKKCGQKCSYIGSKIFVLECFPYHSVSFPLGLIKKTKYYEFWLSLVKWAVGNQKYFILRSPRIRQILSADCVRLPDGKVIEIKNSRKVSLTRNNLRFPSAHVSKKVTAILLENRID